MDEFTFYESKKEIEEYQEKYLIKPIVKIISAYAFNKKIIGFCEYVFENFIPLQIDNYPLSGEYIYITVCNNKIYKLKKSMYCPKI